MKIENCHGNIKRLKLSELKSTWKGGISGSHGDEYENEVLKYVLIYKQG